MFNCETSFYCDICGKGTGIKSDKMPNCPSHLRYQHLYKERGWKVVYGKYDVCKDCILHYGIKEIRRILKERMDNGTQ